MSPTTTTSATGTSSSASGSMTLADPRSAHCRCVWGLWQCWCWLRFAVSGPHQREGGVGGQGSRVGGMDAQPRRARVTRRTCGQRAGRTGTDRAVHSPLNPHACSPAVRIPRRSPSGRVGYRNFDIMLGTFLTRDQLYATSHAPCDEEKNAEHGPCCAHVCRS